MSLLMDALRKAEEAKKQAENAARAQLLQTDSGDAEQFPEISPVDGLDKTEPENAADSDADIILEFETFPETPSLNSKASDGDITIDLGPVAENDEIENQLETQSLELETIPFKDEIPTLVPDLSLAELAMEPDLLEGVHASSKESSENSEISIVDPEDNAFILDQESKHQAQQQELEASVETTQQLQEPGAVALELETLVEDFKPDAEQPAGVENLATVSEPEPLATKASEQPDQIQQTRARTVASVTNEKSHFSAQSLFAAKVNVRKAKRQRLQVTGLFVMVLTASGAFAYTWWSSRASTPFVSGVTNYLNGEELASLSDPLVTNAAPATEGVNQLRSETTVTAPPTEVVTVIAETASLQDSIVATVGTITTEPNRPPAQTTTESSSSNGSKDSNNAVAETPVSASPAAQVYQPGPSTQPTNSQQSLQADAVEISPSRNFISFNRSSGQTMVIDSALEKAFQAYQSGDLDSARDHYQAALLAAPLNRNALLGLAAIAAGKKESIVALDLYSRLLSRDPTDPIARAGILDLQPAANVQQQERELKNLISAHPDIAPLSYALGNLYATAQRWSDAQQAYFNALRIAKRSSLEPGAVNPDYAYNLAVSLEHLSQPTVAQTYYQEALEYSAYHPASFNVELVRVRLTNLGDGQTQ